MTKYLDEAKEYLLQVADETYWTEIIKTRDFISHHYIDIDAEVVFDICSNELDELKEKINQLYEENIAKKTTRTHKKFTDK